MATLKSIHQRTLNLSQQRHELNKEFFAKLSHYKSIKSFVSSFDEVKSDDGMAKFLAIIAKESFEKKEGLPISVSMMITKKEATERLFEENVQWEITISIDPHEKQITLTGSWSNWDHAKVRYTFNCFDLNKGILISAATTGKSQYWRYVDSFHDPEESNWRDDNDARNLIRILFKRLKEGALKKLV